MKPFRKKAIGLIVALIMALSATAMAADQSSHTDKFTDVPESHLFRNSIHWASDLGIIYGYGGPSDTPIKFGPEDFATRGQLTAILHRYHTKLVIPAIEDGSDGQNGSQGEQGEPGPAGPPGPPGADGKDGTFSCSEGFVLGVITVEVEKAVASGLSTQGGSHGSKTVEIETCFRVKK